MFDAISSFQGNSSNIDLISIHIPKTAGTSFYSILTQVYPDTLSISYKRKDYLAALNTFSSFEESLAPHIKVLHGHLYFRELEEIQKKSNAKVICWLRNPVDRIVSNYQFFKKGLRNPSINPSSFAINKHRINETLLEYASLEENQNRMSDFLEGIKIEDLFFIGLQEHFEKDIMRLGRLLGWREVSLVRLNTSDKNTPKTELSSELIRHIKYLNKKDVELYNYVCNSIKLSDY